MGSYVQTLYQIVYSTKHRERTLIKEGRYNLHKYIWGILTKKKCHLYRVNSVDDHLHIVTSLHQSIALASLVKDIKLGCSDFIKRTTLFPDFAGWQDKYAAFTYSIEAKDNLIEYVKNQEAHHYTKSYEEELIELLQEHHVEFDSRFLD
jgi:putative transposase